ncbi:alpha/beta-hydrolase [Auricularia subglabra TFB-10046 SS5]|nr:alpha/beta-hydrolase [Auricularia subglabra TFB-10046 SS5]
MYPEKSHPAALLPVSAPPPQTARKRSSVVVWTALACLALVHFSGGLQAALTLPRRATLSPDSFFWTLNDASSLCPGVHNNVSYSGYIGLRGDSDETPRRSFYWLFEAQQHPETAPLILTIGGGPGSSGLLNPLFALSHCKVAQGAMVPNPTGWSEHANILALDHPIGVGFSYGSHVNNSRDAAHDVYDFLQKFFVLYPHFARNKFIISSGSYGGTYVPNIASVIHQHNKELAHGRGPAGARHINLESLMLSNPLSDARSWFSWHLQNVCHNAIRNAYNETQCEEYYQLLPGCLETVQFAYEHSTPENRLAAFEECAIIISGDMHGLTSDNIRHTCESRDPLDCNPEFGWAVDILNDNTTKATLGVPTDLKYESVSVTVNGEFISTGDHIHETFRLYEPLLADEIRVLHYIGKLDAIVSWQSTLSFLRLIDSPFAEEFRKAQDVPWPSADVATVRAIGPGAGNFTLVLVAEAGHFVAKDQPELSKSILEHWLKNEPFDGPSSV